MSDPEQPLTDLGRTQLDVLYELRRCEPADGTTVAEGLAETQAVVERALHHLEAEELAVETEMGWEVSRHGEFDLRADLEWRSRAWD